MNITKWVFTCDRIPPIPEICHISGNFTTFIIFETIHNIYISGEIKKDLE